MEQQLKNKLEEIYKRYGFEQAKIYENENTIVFTLKTGYFDNADIVPLSEDACTDKAFSDFSKANFACTIRKHLNPEQTAEELFKGFFSASQITERLKSDYLKFTESIARQFSDDAKYTYINAPYHINGKIGTTSPAEEVVSRLAEKKPILFLIEAAAGFGKTCTAFELVNKLVTSEDYLPLFSELSRNRKAPIFRYVLLDEIDRRFPTLSSRLVQAEMKNGKVVTILDGFDELLRKSEDVDDFENQEPMLETIGQFLTGCAKIILTSRRTVLFEGDSFHNWALEHKNEFELVKIRIGEPSLVDWLPEERLNAIQSTSLDIKNSLANPVLLSYLRCIPQDKFDAVIQSPQGLVEKYFSFLLDRERERQDLKLSVEQQKTVLTTIAKDMIDNGYTSEQREHIVEIILRNCSKELEESLVLYPTSDRPDKEYLANKIASHALLDRSTKEENKIGFINEFVLGYFVSNNIIQLPEWLNDDIRFLEPAVLSYTPRSLDDKKKLLEKLKESLEFVAISYRADFTSKLIGEIDFDLISEEAEGLNFEGIVIGTHSVTNFQFNDCVFKNCKFLLKRFDNITFLNCKFYDNNISAGLPLGPIYILGEQGNIEFLKDAISEKDSASDLINDEDDNYHLERHVLEKFWPVGREKFTHKHRPIAGICSGHGDFRPDEIYKAIVKLKKDGILLQPNSASFVELNFDRLNDIRKILGRQ